MARESIAGAFYDRLTKLAVPEGMELDIDTNAAIAGKAAAATTGDPAQTKALTKEVIKRATVCPQYAPKVHRTSGDAKRTSEQLDGVAIAAAKDLNIDLDADKATAVKSLPGSAAR